MGEPRINLSFEDLYQSDVESNTENTLFLIGLASDGPMDTVATLQGMSGLRAYEAIAGTTGRLPHACREAIDVATQAKKAITVKAMRCGADAAKAFIEFQNDSTTAVALTVTYAYDGTAGNSCVGMVAHDVATIIVTLSKTGLEEDEVDYEGDTLAEVKAAIDASGYFTAEIALGETTLADVEAANFAGGLDGELTAAEVIRALQITEGFDLPNVIVLGANTTAMRASISTHCANQLLTRQNPRYAFVEMDTFDSTNVENSALWRIDVETWAAGIVADLEEETDYNLIAFAGQAKFLDAAGAEYEAPSVATGAARVLGEPIHRSMINLQTPTVQSLVPNIPPEIRDTLADGRVNYLKYEKGRGYITANDRTLAESTSDFKYAQTVRTLYTCGAEALEAGKPVWGTPNDPAKDDGLAKIKAAMEKPLENRKGVNISDYEVTPKFVGENQVEATVGITEYETMRDIEIVFYVKRS